MIWATFVVISLSNSDVRKGRVVLDKEQVTNLSDVEKVCVTLRAARTTLTPACRGVLFSKTNICPAIWDNLTFTLR